MQKHMTIINLACTITKLRKWGEAWKHSAESAQANTARLHQANKELEREKFMTAGLIDKLIADRDEAWKERDTQTADHEAKMAEHRAAFGARTEADRQIIAGLREESAKYKAERDDLYQREGIEQKRRMDVEDERNALRAEVADLRGIVDMVHASLGIKRGDHIGNAIAQLKAQTPKRSHPVAVGEYLRRLTGFSTTPAGEVAQVLHVACGQYTVKRPNGQQGVWFESGCEPCDPPATHDTEAGKAVAESAVSETVADEIKVGDVVRPKCWGIGQMTKVTQVLPDGRLLIENSIKTWEVAEVVKLVRKCVGADEAWTEVRKVTT